MAKWADYCISAVSYDEKHSHIEKVKVHEDLGESIGISTIWLREAVVLKLKDNYSFITIRESSDNKWIRGEDVRIVHINRVDYLRTDNNNITSDNLGELPEF